MTIIPVNSNAVRRPLVYMLLAYVVGIVWGSYCSIERLALILTIVLLLPAAIISLWFKHALLPPLLLLCACTFLGNLLFSVECAPGLSSDHVSHFIADKKIIIEGVLYKSPQVFPAKTRYYVQAKKIIEREREIPVRGKLLLTVHHTLDPLRYGDVVRFSCRMRLPRNFNNPGGFNYGRFLAFQGIHVTASLDSKHTIVKVGTFPVNSLLYRVEAYRTEIKIFFTAHLGCSAAAIATALITGDQSGIAEEIRDRFSITGVAHLLAISGLHIGIIALISFTLLKSLFRCSTRLMLMTNITKLAACITLFPVSIYCLIAGAGIAAIRATVMVIFYLLSIIIDRQDDLWNTLALAAFCILVVCPSSLFDPSFQLSFSSVAAILYLTPRFPIAFGKKSPDFPGLRRPWYKALASQGIAMLTVTLSATLGTAPIVSLYFNRCSPWGLPANLIVVPITGFVVVPLGLLSSLLLFVAEPLAMVTVQIMQVFLNLSAAAVYFFSRMPYADYRTATPTIPELVLYYAGLFLLFTGRRSPMRRYALTAVGFIFIINCGYWHYQVHLNPRLRITAIDVGQGDAALLQLPKGKAMLIDGGGSYDNSFDLGGMVVAPLLWKKKIKHIDVLVLSHPHPDHLNGLIPVMKHFSIGEVWTNGASIETDAFKEFEGIRAAKKIKQAVMARGHPPAYINGVGIEFLHPGQSCGESMITSANDRMNNNSLALRLTFREVNIIFTGDMYAAAEREIMALFPGLRSTILKIPHHGSATSSSKAFLEKLAPRIALLSVGRDNSFNLPHPAVIKRYENIGCTVYRTDEDGAVTVETDGQFVHIRTYLDRNQANRSYDAR